MTIRSTVAARRLLLLSVCAMGLALPGLAPAMQAAPAAKAARPKPVDPATIPPAIRPPNDAEQARIGQITDSIQSATAERRWADAVVLGRQALAIEEATSGPEHPEVAGTLGLIAGWLSEQDKFAEAEPLLKRSLAIFEKSLGAGHPLTASAANSLAANYQAQGRFADAQPIYQRTLDANLKTYGERHRRVALSYNNFGYNLARQGRYLEAKTFYDQALAIGRSALDEEDADLALIENNVASNLDALGRYFEAEPLYRQALAIRVATLGNGDPQVATSYNNLGFNLNAQGRYLEAEPAYRKALDIRAKLNPEGRAAATSYNNVAHNLNDRGDYLGAAPLYARALAIWEKIYGPDHPVTSIGYSNVAVNLEKQGKAAQAQPLFEKALKIRLAKLGATHPDIATGRIKLAHALASQKKYALAAPLYDKAIEARRTLLGPLHPDLAEGLTDQAELLSELGAAQRLKAIAAAREAMEIVRQRRESRLSGEAAGNAGAVQQTLARVAGEDATRADPLAGAFSAFLRAAWLRSKDVAGEAPALRADGFAAAQDLGTSAAAKTMAQTAARTAAGTGALNDLVRRQQDLSARVHELDGRVLAALTAGDMTAATGLRNELIMTGKTLAGVNSQLRKDFPDYAELVQPRALSIADTQARLKDDEAVLMIVPAGADVYSFAVAKGSVAWSRLDGGAARLPKAIGLLLCQVDPETCARGTTDAELDAGSSPGSAFVTKGYAAFDRATAYGLYRDLVAPVEAAIRDKKKLYVVTSGALAGLPLGLLPTTAPGAGEDGADPSVLAKTEWLADRYALSSLPSVSVLRALRRTTVASRPGSVSFIGYGAPTLDGPDKSNRSMPQFLGVFKTIGPDGLALADPLILRSLAPLPGTAVELSAMAKTLKASAQEIHLGQQATETSVRGDTALRRARILAFATHGVLPGEVRGFEEPGLVFTPPANPSSQDDGLLTASEVSNMSLSADWVILSACNTASADGTPGADSLSSLARSFLYAGASALLASHWRVADDATAALTVEALGLRQGGGGLSRAEALKTAMHTVRTGKRSDGSALPGWNDAWSHPGAWAPFTVISNEDQ
jgi:CHAT domain-containing protein/tetratricopeptide (TPR) repeat protein